MKVLFFLVLAAGAYCAVNCVAGFSSLSVYVISGRAGPWQNFIDKCQEFEDNRGVVRGINCVSNGVFYLMGAAVAFGAGQAGVMYFQTKGVTTQGKRHKRELVLGTGLLFILILAASTTCSQMDSRARWLVVSTTIVTAILGTRLLFSWNQPTGPSQTALTSPTASSPSCREPSTKPSDALTQRGITTRVSQTT